MKKLMAFWTAFVLLFPAMTTAQGPDHQAKQAIKDAKRLSEGQKRQAMKDLQGKEGGYGAQDLTTKRTLQSMDKSAQGKKQ